jgi:hypothetical protein
MKILRILRLDERDRMEHALRMDEIEQGVVWRSTFGGEATDDARRISGA